MTHLQPFDASDYAALLKPRVVEKPTEKADSSMIPFIIIAVVILVVGIALIQYSTSPKVPALKPKLDIKDNQVA
jgi:hypothetical protein